MADLSIKTLPSQHISQAAFQKGQWSPYVINGGTVLAVAGTDFVVVAGDTRMSSGYNIMSRDVPKLYQLTPHCILATAGMTAEAKTLRKVLHAQAVQYKFKHQKDISAPSVAQLLSNTLYYKRFFPYYTFNVLAGLDNEGKGAVWGYDAIGSFERNPYSVTGSGSALITSILDNQVAHLTQKEMKSPEEQKFPALTHQQTVDLVKDVFTCAGERDIYTGDYVDICVITKDGTSHERLELRKD